MRKIWTEDKIKQLEELSYGGATTEEISKIFNTTHKAIRTALCRHQVGLYQNLKPEEINFIINNYRLIGASKCARILNTTRRIIYSFVNKSGIFIPKKNKISDEIEMTVGQFEDIRKGAKQRGIEFNVTAEYLWDLFIKQNRKCALSDIDITFDGYTKSRWSASLDRIDSKIPYIIGNVQWLHKDINMIKWKLKEKLFLEYIQKIYNYRIKPLIEQRKEEQENADYCI